MGGHGRSEGSADRTVSEVGPRPPGARRKGDDRASTPSGAERRGASDRIPGIPVGIGRPRPERPRAPPPAAQRRSLAGREDPPADPGACVGLPEPLPPAGYSTTTSSSVTRPAPTLTVYSCGRSFLFQKLSV